MKNVAVIGAGTMGNGIAHTFAQFDYKVQLIDVNKASLDKGIATITKNLDRMVAKQTMTEEDKNRTLKNITTFTSIEEGVEYASLVVEAATENVDFRYGILVFFTSAIRLPTSDFYIFLKFSMIIIATRSASVPC